MTKPSFYNLRTMPKAVQQFCNNNKFEAASVVQLVESIQLSQQSMHVSAVSNCKT